MTPFIFWAILVCFHLFILTYQDVTQKQWVDDRHNWLISGATFMLIPFYGMSLGELGFFFLFNIFLFVMMKRFIAQADLSCIASITLGLLIVDPVLLFKFMMVWVLAHLLGFALDKFYGRGRTMAYYPIITGSFLICLFI